MAMSNTPSAAGRIAELDKQVRDQKYQYRAMVEQQANAVLPENPQEFEVERAYAAAKKTAAEQARAYRRFTRIVAGEAHPPRPRRSGGAPGGGSGTAYQPEPRRGVPKRHADAARDAASGDD